jgi:tetratricopeptide (TPR) repeat protein
VVLELLNQLWSTRRRATPVSTLRRDAVRRAVIAVRPKAARQVLDELLDLAVPGVHPQLDVLTALRRYGTRLQDESEFRLAAHVYRIVIDYAGQGGFLPLVAATYEHLGTCQREYGDRRAAIASYGTGIGVAERCRDEHTRLRIAIAKGNLYRVLNKPAEARATLEPVLLKVKALEIPELIARAAHELGNVSHSADQYEEALAYYVEAFETCVDVKERSRLLNDFALSLAEMGFPEEARAIWLFVFQSPKGEKYARWAAGINLLMLARVREDVMSFDHWRRDLESAPMSARLLTYFWLEVGDGSTVFGRPKDAVIAYTRAKGVAERSGLKVEAERAKQALEGAATIPEPRPPKDSSTLPIAVAGVIDRVRALRSTPALAATPITPRRTFLRRGRPRRSDVA